TDVIRVGSDVELDGPRMEARFGGRRIDLTKTEFQLLSTMARQPGRVFTRPQLLDAVRGVAFESYERAIDAHVKNIRRKIEADPRRPHYLLTVFGVGYRFAQAAACCRADGVPRRPAAGRPGGRKATRSHLGGGAGAGPQ